jgi:hypothetical protein
MADCKPSENLMIEPYEDAGPGTYITVNMANGGKAVYFSRGELRVWQNAGPGGIPEPRNIDISDAILISKEGPTGEVGAPVPMPKIEWIAASPVEYHGDGTNQSEFAHEALQLDGKTFGEVCDFQEKGKWGVRARGETMDVSYECDLSRMGETREKAKAEFLAACLAEYRREARRKAD